MNTVLKTILLKPELKSGVIVAPCLSGKTHALCAKAIQLASEGQQVLLVVPTILSAKAEGGVAYELAKQLIDSNHPYRISPESLNISIGGGKIKVCDLFFTPDKKFDTMIVMDGIKDPLRIGRGLGIANNKIYCVTAYDLALGYDLEWNKGFLGISHNLNGDISRITLTPQINNDHTYKLDEGTLLLNHAHGWFSILINKPSSLLTDTSELYLRHLNSSDATTKIRMLETDIFTCYKYIYG